jgi:hypothetical protein
VFAHKGFQIVFENGWEISCMFGMGNYASTCYSAPSWPNKVIVSTKLESEDCEIAIFNPKGEMVGEPCGWQTPDDLLKALDFIMMQEVYSLAQTEDAEAHF